MNQLDSYTYHMHAAQFLASEGDYAYAVQRCREAIMQCHLHVNAFGDPEGLWHAREHWAYAVESAVLVASLMRKSEYRLMKQELDRREGSR